MEHVMVDLGHLHATEGAVFSVFVQNVNRSAENFNIFPADGIIRDT